jgi:uncharacterized membrane protein
MGFIFAIPRLALSGNIFLPYINIIISITSLLLIFTGMKGLATHYKDESIYKNARKIAILNVAGIIVGVLSQVTPVTTNALDILKEGVSGATALPIILLVLILIAALAIFVLNIVYLRRIIIALAEHSGKEEFRTANTLLLYGLILLIVLVGAFLLLIAYVFIAVGLFSLKATDTKTKRCTQCGTPLAPESIFCTQCGKQI